MTLHTFYDHQCPSCEAFYIPYDDVVPCPNCGLVEEERYDFITEAADSVIDNLRHFGSCVPDAWLVDSYGDHILRFVFHILQMLRDGNDGDTIEAIARFVVDRMGWEGQEYAKDHLFAIACRVHEELGTRPPPYVAPRDEKTELTGRLEGWSFDGSLVYGSIYDDTTGRVLDGTQIRTSPVLTAAEEIMEGATIRTENSTYLLGEEDMLTINQTTSWKIYNRDSDFP